MILTSWVNLRILWPHLVAFAVIAGIIFLGAVLLRLVIKVEGTPGKPAKRMSWLVTSFLAMSLLLIAIASQVVEKREVIGPLAIPIGTGLAVVSMAIILGLALGRLWRGIERREEDTCGDAGEGDRGKQGSGDCSSDL